MSYDDEDYDGNGDPPVNSIRDLPKYTRDFLRDLRREDVDMYQAMIKRERRWQVLGSFSKWAVATAFIVFTTLVGVWDDIVKFFHYWRGQP